MEQVTLSQRLNEKLLSLSTIIDTLKSFVLEHVFVIKKTIQDKKELHEQEGNKQWLFSVVNWPNN